jgi:hypothetical protein
MVIKAVNCVIFEGRYCPGCLIRYDRNFYAGIPYDPEEEETFAMLDRRDEHEARCIAYRDRRIMASLRFYAQLDAERAPGSW